MSDKPTTLNLNFNSDCFHCVIGKLTQEMIRLDFVSMKRAIGDMMQVVAELVESLPADERELARDFAKTMFIRCCNEARTAFDTRSPIDQPPAGHA